MSYRISIFIYYFWFIFKLNQTRNQALITASSYYSLLPWSANAMSQVVRNIFCSVTSFLISQCILKAEGRIGAFGCLLVPNNEVVCHAYLTFKY